MAHDHTYETTANTGAEHQKRLMMSLGHHLDGIHSGSRQRNHHRIIGATRRCRPYAH